jgi:hypothetical protein
MASLALRVECSTRARLETPELGRDEPSWLGSHRDYTTNSLPRKGRKSRFPRAKGQGDYYSVDGATKASAASAYKARAQWALPPTEGEETQDSRPYERRRHQEEHRRA